MVLTALRIHNSRVNTYYCNSLAPAVQIKQKQKLIIWHCHRRRLYFGISTLSMMCTTPLLAPTSAVVTFALRLRYTFFSYTSMSTSPPSRVFTFCSGFRSAACTAAPAITWYSSTASNSLMCRGSSKCFSISAGSLANASLVGAKTVKGPLPDRAPVRLPALSAATKVERSLSPSASCTIFLAGGEGGEGPFEQPVALMDATSRCTLPATPSPQMLMVRTSSSVFSSGQ